MSKFLIDVQRCKYKTETAEFRANITGLDKVTTEDDFYQFSDEIITAIHEVLRQRLNEIRIQEAVNHATPAHR